MNGIRSVRLLIFSVIFSALGFGLSACSTMTYTTLPGELYPESNFTYREVGQFEIELTENYWLFGFAKASDEKIARAVVEEVRRMGGNGVRNLHYKVESNFADTCISCIATPITYSRQTVTVAGTVVQISGSKSVDNLSLEQLQQVAEGKDKNPLPIQASY